MRLVIVSGLSGAGKSSVMKILEDDGFYCVDNLPVPLVPDFLSLLDIRETLEAEKAGNLHPDYVEDIAIGLDVRGLRFTSGSSDDAALEKMLSVIGFFRKQGYSIDIIFLEASTQVLVKRYKETRRIHPLFRMSMPGSKSDAGSAPGDGVDVAESGVRVGDAIELEGRLLRPIREAADVILDTSSLLVRDLKQEIDRLFLGENTSSNFYLTFVSFGYKYGIPTDADLVFDVRFLPNPFYVDELKHKTGNDPQVQAYVCQTGEADEFLEKTEELLDYLIPKYRAEGKRQLMICVGCTGGKHRSVTLANRLADYYDQSPWPVCVLHRDIANA